MDLLELWWVAEVLKGGAVAALGAVASSGSQWVSALFLSQEMPGTLASRRLFASMCCMALHPLCPAQFSSVGFGQ